jgi:hypothetical protein
VAIYLTGGCLLSAVTAMLMKKNLAPDGGAAGNRRADGDLMIQDNRPPAGFAVSSSTATAALLP